MPHCTKCGTELAATAGFCPSCGQPQAAASGGAAVTSGSQSGLKENVAGALAYALGWVTGIIFILIDKRPFVRFHAAQSIVVFGGLQILMMIIGGVFGMGWFWGGGWGWGWGWGMAGMLIGFLSLVRIILWIVLIIKAAQGERFRVPVAADLAENIAGRN